jgi:hypothetical protein
LLIISALLFALSLSCWWMQRVAFSPNSDADATRAILDDTGIRSEIATVIASADAPTLEQSPAQLKEFIEQIAALDAGGALMTEFVADAHARLIGDTDEAVQVSGPVQVTIVRDERVATLAPVTIPVQEVGALPIVDSLAGWTALISAGLGVLCLIGGIVLRPERGETILALATGLGGLAVLLVLLGYLVPVAVLPALSDTTWMGVFPALANHNRTLTFGAAIISGACAVGLWFFASSSRPRPQTSTPLSMGRYREQHRWSS